MRKSRNARFVVPTNWYILRWGSDIKVANLTSGQALRLHEEGWHLGERIFDSFEEAANYKIELQNRSQKLKQSQRALNENLCAASHGAGFGQIAAQALSSPGSAIARRLDLGLSAAMFNGSSLREMYQMHVPY
jgi:hypothetical protein